MVDMRIVALFGMVILCISHSFVSGKECTNIPTPLSSHTARFELLSSKNESWKEGSRSYFLVNHVDESTWIEFNTRKLLGWEISGGEFDWGSLDQGVGYSGGANAAGEGFLNEIPLHDIRLDPDSKHGRAQQTNLEYLLMLDVDRLVWSFRKQAGLPGNGTPYGGWEGPDVELRGHFVGHYLSATAMMWASTHNETLKEKMFAVVDALSACQKNMGTGYLSAFPSEFFDRVEAVKPVWAPYYTIHKIMAGLLDQYLFAGSNQALQMVVWMAEYFAERVKNVILKYSIERHWLSLNEETGGMNEVLYNLYTVTGDKKHLILAHLFDKPCFLGLLAVKADSISGFHSNTHIPIVIGAQKRYEVEGDSLYKDIGTYFMDIVNSSHSYVTGGTSVDEFWSDPKRLADTLKTENEESCTTYNMLKVSRNLFRGTKKMAYADYYERALTNGVLSIQKENEPGVMIYMLPLGHGVSKARSYHKWGTPFDAFWCCYGTGIESFSKLGDSIYFEENGSTPGLFIIQYLPSSLNWKNGGIAFNITVGPVSSHDPFMRVTLTISSVKVDQSSTLNLRIPFWSSLDGATATINGEKLIIPPPGNFLSITRQWVASDKLMLQLPIGLRVEMIQDDRPQYASIQAILFGPYVLAGLSSGDWDISVGNASSVSDWVKAVPREYNSQLVSLSQESGNGSLFFSNSNNFVTMDQLPKAGTDSAIHATFRLVHMNSGDQRLSFRITNGRPVMLEPFDNPGWTVMHHGPKNSIAISASSDAAASVFLMVDGLGGKSNTISLEAESNPNCFISSYANSTLGKNVQLVCLEVVPSSNDVLFRNGSSFAVGGGLRNNDPISFIAEGLKRSFVLEPLLGLRDESYNVYFNITA